jgi:multicomponent Na+:H+ antiporter subunit D
MTGLLPFTVAMPLLFAGLLTATRKLLPRTVAQAVGLVIAGFEVTAFALLIPSASAGRLVYWVGGWTPAHGVPLGVALVLDGVGAEMGALVALIALASLISAWHTVRDDDGHFQPLMLLFMGAMAGLCIAGDLFTMFVFFELMGVAAYALTTYDAQPGGLKGGLIFAVTNSVGGLFILLGIVLLYGRTGALNLAAIGNALATRPIDTLVIVALILTVTGFLVKGAIVPFHFWLADAHAVAPAPVSALFSGVMVELGLYGASRIYWTVFSGTVYQALPVLRAVLLALAVATMLVGAMMSWRQRHVKRLLAFSTVSHSGIAWAGFALFATTATAGSAIYMPGHGLVKATLFLVVAALLSRCGSVDELVLRGKARDQWWLAGIFVIAALILSGVPPLGTFSGHSLIEAAASRSHAGWLAWVLLVSVALTGGAALRVAGRVFGGWGKHPGMERYGPTTLREEDAGPKAGTVPWTSVAAPALLLLASIVISVLPAMRNTALVAATQFQDRRGYALAVLTGHDVPSSTYRALARAATLTPEERHQALLFGVAGVVLALGLAVAALRRQVAVHAVDAVTRWLERMQSGAVGDYVMWLILGVAAVMVAVR